MAAEQAGWPACAMPCFVKTKRAWRANRRTIQQVARAFCCQNAYVRNAGAYVGNVRADLDLITTVEDPNLRLGWVSPSAGRECCPPSHPAQPHLLPWAV